MLQKIVACTLALCLAAGALFGALCLTADENAADAVTLCDLDYADIDL